MDKYNGWNSYETWLYNIHYGFDYHQETCADIIEEGKQKDYTKEEIENALYMSLRELINEDLENTELETGNLTFFAKSILQAGIREVDKNELARAYTEEAMSEYWENK